MKLKSMTSAFRFFHSCSNAAARAFAIAVAAMLFAPAAHAASITWSGATNTWNTNTNWVGSVLPVSGDSLVFDAAGAGGLLLNNDLTSGSFTVSSITFGSAGTAGAYVIGDGTAGANVGNTFVLANPAANSTMMQNCSGNLQTINTPFSTTGNDDAITGGADIALAGNISGGGSFVKAGSNTLSLSGNNTFTGQVRINLGVLRLDSTNAIPGGIGAAGGLSNINFNSGGVIGLAAGDFTRGLGAGATQVQFGNPGGWAAFGANRLVNLGGASASVAWVTATTGLNGKNLILSHPTATHTLDFQNPLDMGTAARTVQVDNGSASIDGIISGNITGGTGGNLAKTGDGTLALTGGASNYTGTTTISLGTLLVNGTKSGTGAVTVSSGAALGGTGTLNGAVTVSAGGRINLANGAVGNLSLGTSLTLSGSAATPNHLFFDLGNGAGGNDKIIDAGAHAAGTANGVMVHLNQLSGAVINPGPYTLIQGGAASTFTGYTLATTRAGRNEYSALGASGNDLQVTVAAGSAGDTINNHFWQGDTSAWNTAQWYSDAAGTTMATTPGYSSNVRFGTTTATNLTNTLGRDFEINSLTVDSGLSAISISGNMLTIDATTDNGNILGNGITVNNAAGTTIASKVGLANSQTWTVDTGAALTVSGVVSDFGNGYSLTKAGAGTLTLSGVNIFNGPLTVSGGTLAIGGAGLLNNGSYGANIVNNGILSYGSSVNQTLNGIISGTGALTKSGSSTLTLNNSGTFTGGATISGGTLSIPANLINPLGAGTTTVSTGGTYALSATLVTAPLVLNGGTVTAGNSFGSSINGPMTLDAVSTISVTGNLTINSNITGTGGLIKTGSAFVPLNGTNNNYTGTTTIGVNGGGLTLKSSLYGNDTTKWIPTNITVNSGGALVMNVGGPGEFTISQAGTMFSQLGGAVNNNGLLAGSQFGVDTRTSGGNFTISDNLIDSSGPGGGAVGFRYVGNGTTGGSTLELTGNNTYSGVTIVDRAGTIKVSSINSVNGGSPPLASSSLGRPTTIANGTIQLGSSASFIGGNLTYTGTGETTDRVVNLGGANGSVYTFDQSGTGLLKFTSGFTMTDLRGPQTIELKGSTAGTGEMAGVLPTGDGASSNRLTKSGTGKWTLSAANLNGGIVTLTDGVLSVSTISDGGISGVATTTAGSAIVTLTTGTTAGMTVGMTVASTAIPIGRTVASIDSATQFTLSSGTSVGAATLRSLIVGTPSNLGITPALAANLVFNGGTLQYTGANASTNRNFTINAGKVATLDITTNNLTMSGASTATTGALTKTGAGTLTLSGANLYTGATTVTQGTLALGANNVFANTAVSIGGGILNAATFTDTVGTLDVTAAATINLGAGAALAFANSSAIDWTGGTLNVTGTLGATSLRFGTDNTGLTSGQLALISVNGSGLGTYTLDSNGYLVSAGSPYTTWSGGAAFGVDTNGDGVKNGMAWVLGASDKDVSALGLLPTVDNSDPTYLIFNYRRKDDANTDANTTIAAQYGTDLTGWTTAVHNGTTIIITPTDNFYSASPGVDKVEVKIARSLAPGGKLFVRLNTVQTP